MQLGIHVLFKDFLSGGQQQWPLHLYSAAPRHNICGRSRRRFYVDLWKSLLFNGCLLGLFFVLICFSDILFCRKTFFCRDGAAAG